ncbi:MAG: lipase maturation factor family protein, partial [Burkholderiales bacterium]
VYRFVAAHRPLFHRLSLWLWGKDYAPPRFERVSWLFLRAIGLIYFAAFVSFGVQALGLIGSNGILPLSDFITALNQHFGARRYWFFPMLFWLNVSDFAIQASCWAGAALSLLVVFKVLPRLSLLLLYLLYLSLFYAGQDFMTFQWDLLLLEAGFLALLLSTGSRLGIWLLRWLLFRLMFLSGAVKLLSGDPSWADFSALGYHFMTQPLPTPLAWYAQHLPQSALRFATGATFFIELALPFLIFCPRRLRFAAACGFLLLQATILLTGNYNFFNLLTLALCLCLFDDQALARLLPLKPGRTLEMPGKIAARVVAAFALLIALVSSAQLYSVFSGRTWAPWLNNGVAPLRIVNTYGLFAVMTTERPEIIIEGSNDGKHWLEYSFKYKPGDVRRAPAWNIPHQPRLDWQMWFAALDGQAQHPWFGHFLQRLLENSPEVIALLDGNPFPGKPPRYVRALLYDYRYASAQERKTPGLWWKRQLTGIYYPAVELRHAAPGGARDPA